MNSAAVRVNAARGALAVLLAAVVSIAVTGSAGAQDADVVTVRATVDGRDVEGAGSNDPVRLEPLEVSRIELEVTNDGDDEVLVRRARLFGEAFGLTLVAYDAIVTVPVAAGETIVIDVPVEFIDLERQATGLLPGGVAVFDDQRQVLGEQRFVIDVRGSLTSAMGLFGIFITLATVAGIVGIALAVQRRTLGPNRVRRMVRFGFVGLGVGLSLVIGLAVFRVVAPTGWVWVPLTVLPTLIAGALGFFSPGPLRAGLSDAPLDLDDELDLIEVERELDEVERTAAAAAVETADGSEPVAGT